MSADCLSLFYVLCVATRTEIGHFSGFNGTISVVRQVVFGSDRGSGSQKPLPPGDVPGPGELVSGREYSRLSGIGVSVWS